MLKFASYNIHKGIGLDRRRDPERIIAVLNEIDADIIALQEADRRFGSRAAVIPERLLEAHSDFRAVPLDVQSDSMGWHGNVILHRQAMEVLAHDILHIPCLEPRGAVMARIRHGGMTVTVFGMHLDLSGLWRRRQAQAMMHLADQAREDGPVVMMGDLNEWSAQGGCLRDFSRSFAFADCGRSFHARRPITALDRIMYSDGLALARCGVHSSALSRRASDHLPVWAELQPV